MAHSDIGEIRDQAEDLEKPKHNDDNDYGVENAFDGGLHGDVAVDKPENNSDDDQIENYLNQGHRSLLFKVQQIVRIASSLQLFAYLVESRMNF